MRSSSGWLPISLSGSQASADGQHETCTTCAPSRWRGQPTRFCRRACRICRDWPDTLAADLIGSWTRIFDVLDSTSLQGAFERLDRVDVKSIVLGPEPGELHPVRRRSPTSPYGRRNSR